jgi:hypothetical protein
MDDRKAEVEVRWQGSKEWKKIGLKDVTRLLNEKKCRGSFAEGQGTPAYPARLRSGRTRNSSKKTFLTQGSETLFQHASAKEAEKCLRALFPQVRESVASSACGFFAAARDWAGVNQEAGDFPSRSSLLFFVAAE